MTQKLLASSGALLVFGAIGRIYADNYTYIDANDILRDSIWLPIGTLMFLGGALLLPFALGAAGLTALRNR